MFDERLTSPLRRMEAELTALRAQLAAAEEERADLNATFELRHAADVRAIERWRQDHPGRALILPDHTDLCVWLLERLAATEKERDTWHLAHDLSEHTDINAQRAKALEEKLAAAEQRAETAERKLAEFRASTGISREELGRFVREVWIEWAKEQPNPKASWLVPWEDLAEPDREVDRRIGETIAAISTNIKVTAGSPPLWPKGGR